jgi:ribonuclease Y
MIPTIITGFVCLIIGGGAAWYFLNQITSSKSKQIIEDAQKEAETIKKDKLLEVKEKYITLKAELEKQANARNSKIQSQEAKLKQREVALNQRQEELYKKKAESEAIRENMENQLEIIEKKKTRIG